MIKFKNAVITSVFLHIVLFSLALIVPKAKGSSDEIIYYADLMGVSGGKTAGGGTKAVTTKKTDPVPIKKVEEPKTGSVNNLVVKKDTVESKLKFPTNKKKKSPQSKIKKELQEETVTVRRRQKKEPGSTGDNTETALQQEGISTSLGSGSGTGGGSGGIGDFPYSYYVDRMKTLISSSWYKSSTNNKTVLKTVIYFKIHRNGSVSDTEVEEKSGNSMFDQNALRAISRAAPFPPLPSDYPDKYLIVHFEFFRGDE